MEENDGEKEKKDEVINNEIISNNKKKAENLQTKISLLSIDNPQDYENSLDLERKVIEESPKGRFQRFEEELGSGSQKRVFLAYDTDTGCEVAWNSVLVDIKDSDSIQKIKVEIEILKPLKHPNIINFIYCFFNEEKSEIVFITELFSGGSLAQHLMEFKYPRLKLVKLWCQEILKGLKYLHEHNPPIIHRDIKCENIFINKNTGEVKIGDLGLGIILKDTEYASQFCGTIEYCSPEVYQKKYGVKCDIYSLGISIIEIITGEKPYSECKGKILAVCDRVKNGILPECFSLIKNEKVKKFILKCLKPENERPSANELLQDEFLNDLDSEENNYPAIDVSNKYRMNSFKSLGYFVKENDKKEMILDDISSGDIKFNFTYNYKNDATINKFDSLNNMSFNDNKINDNINNDDKDNINNDTNDNFNINNNNKENNPHFIELLKKNLDINNQTKTINSSSSDCDIYFILNEEGKSDIDIDMDIYKITLVKKKGEIISKFNFNYILNTDTIQGVINEIAKIVDLTDNEIKQCEIKLKSFISDLRNKYKEKNELGQQINLINNCYDIFNKEYNDNLKQIQELNKLYMEIKDNSKDYTKEEIEDIDNKMKILINLK